MKYLRYSLKIINPIIWAINVGRYFLNHPVENIVKDSDFAPYDFSRDLKYF